MNEPTKTKGAETYNGPRVFRRTGRTALDQSAANTDAKQAAIAEALARTLADGKERIISVSYESANAWGQSRATYYVSVGFMDTLTASTSHPIVRVYRDANRAACYEER